MNREVFEKPCVISPSLITMDLCNLEAQVKELEQAGSEILHVDLLDGYFSPSMPIGLDVVRQLRKKTNMAFDVHLMTNAQEYFIEELLDIGVQQLVFHGECEPHIDNRLNMIHAHGVRAGVALRPATPLTLLEYVLEKCDAVLLMLINPGYANRKSEKQVPYAERKIRELREMIDHRGLPAKIMIDGRVSLKNLEDYGKNLVDVFVAGSTCILKDDLAGSIKKLNMVRQSIVTGISEQR